MYMYVHTFIHHFIAYHLLAIMAPQHSSPLREDESKTDSKRRGPAQDVPFFYTQSH